MSHIYKKNYLKQVIFRIDFEKVALTDFDHFKLSLSTLFDEKSKKKTKIGNFELKIDSGEVVNKAEVTEEFDIWQFVDTNTGNRFEASPTYCVLEYFAYKNSDTLKENIEAICKKFLAAHNIKQATRIGLRYVNQVDVANVRKRSDWQKYITKELLSNSDFFAQNKKVATRIFNQIEFKSDSFNTLFQHGVWNDKYPSPITASSYILDIDCFTRLPMDIDENELIAIAADLNKEAENIFELSITQKLRTEMEK